MSVRDFLSREYYRKARAYAAAHKFTSAVVLILVLWLLYWAHGKLTSTAGETSYVVANADMGTVIASVTGTGQVSALNQIDVRPKASGDVVYVGVVDGQPVQAGTLIAEIDPQTAQKAVRDAQVNLDSAKLALQKLTQPADALSLTQAQNTLASAQESKQNAQDSLAKSYDDGFNNVANAFLNLPTVMSGLQDTLYGNNIALGGNSQWNIDYYANATVQYSDQAPMYRDDANQKYQTARADYDKTFSDYKSLTRFSDPATIEKLIRDSYTATQAVAEAVKSTSNLIQFYVDQLTQRNLKHNALADTQLATLNTYTGQLTSNLSNLLNSTNSIITSKQTMGAADRSITESTQSLGKLKNGADPLDIRSAQLSVEQRQNALLDAQQNLANYYIRAPFDGSITKLAVQKADSVSSGTIVGVLITKQQVAQISLNEVDAAKIKVGDRATMTFDAVDGLSISGKVASIDTVGTVTQGVVTYSVSVSFDTQDDRVKPGMSVSASIITDMRQNTLVVPNNAVIAQGSNSYVQVFNPPLANSATNAAAGIPSTKTPTQVPVQAGLSDDTSTEILSGIKAGDQVVVRTISGTQTSTSSSAPSLLGAIGAGGRGGAGGAGRVLGR